MACVNFATMPRLPFVTLKNAAVLTLVLGGTAWLGSETVASKVPDFDDLAKRHAPVISPAMPGDLMLLVNPCRWRHLGYVKPWTANWW